MGFLNWLVKPFMNEMSDLEKQILTETLSIEEQEAFDFIRGKTDTYTPPKKQPKEDNDIFELDSKAKVKIFRPLSFNEYIGQDSAKSILKKFISGTRERKITFPHTLIHGNAGCGKTTLVKIVAQQLNKPVVETITSDIPDFEQFKKYIKETKGGILFLDEIHSIERNTAEKLYSIMEDFTYNGKSIMPFTLIGATTELGEIIKTRKPFYDRFKIIIGLDDYSVDDLIKIIKQYNYSMFENDKIHDKIHRKIAKNSRNTPRTALRLLETTIYFNGDIDEVLKSFNIIKNGFTVTDLQLLNYIKQSPTAVGLQGIASYLGTSEANYIFSIEPYLLKSGLIVRTPRGRQITEAGKNLATTLIGGN